MSIRSKKWHTTRIKRLMHDQQGLCALCGQILGEDYTIDHKIPITKGGDNLFSNVQLAHFICNQRRSCTDLDVFLKSLPDEYPEYNNIFINFIPVQIYLDWEARSMR